MEINMTLLILAAGMGSRYGGMKQIDPITDNGEFIIDFSIYDAIRAGFDKVVFIIKRENLEAFKQTVGSRIEPFVKVDYAFQELHDLPKGFSVPEGRVKPWGTSHAVLSAKELVKDNFAVINADDFYGYDAFCKLAAHLKDAKAENGVSPSCMIGYELSKTLTDNGSVSRGECYVNENGYLERIVERTKIIKGEETALYEENGEWNKLPYDTTVSMNCFGFTPEVFDHIERGFVDFLARGGVNELKSECYLPGSVFEMIENGEATVKVYRSEAEWYGVTYQEDKPHVVAAIRTLIEKGLYPEKLWN
ncbi:MAG: nucleotidyltransferase [Ruminococcaceae bacterium]|nr:nucleotidyltransferase [Oscillospiraceae bacterium]